MVLRTLSSTVVHGDAYRLAPHPQPLALERKTPAGSLQQAQLQTIVKNPKSLVPGMSSILVHGGSKRAVLHDQPRRMGTTSAPAAAPVSRNWLQSAISRRRLSRASPRR